MAVNAPGAMGDAMTASPPETLSASHHRRIDLQSPADLFYLMNNARRSARFKIDLHLPLNAAMREGGTGVDGLRAAVEAKVNSYIEETFELAKKGLSVNGVDGEKVLWEKEVPEEFEPFDHDLANRIASMHAEIEALNLSLANTRREAAAQAAKEYENKFTEHSRELDAALSREEEMATTQSAANSQPGGSTDVLNKVQLGIDGREEEVRRIWETALERLGKLETGLGETRNHAEEAEKVVLHLEGKS